MLLFPGSFASSGAWLFNKKVEYPENLKEAIQVKNTQPPSKEAEHPDSSGNGLIRDSDNRKHGNILYILYLNIFFKNTIVNCEDNYTVENEGLHCRSVVALN